MVKAHELRTKSKAELVGLLTQQRQELANLRVSARTGGSPARITKIRVARKDIARILTVISQNQNAALRKGYKGKKNKPKKLRPRLTHAKRAALKPWELASKTLRQKKKDAAFPLRKFAIRLE